MRALLSYIDSRTRSAALPVAALFVALPSVANAAKPPQCESVVLLSPFLAFCVCACRWQHVVTSREDISTTGRLNARCETIARYNTRAPFVIRPPPNCVSSRLRRLESMSPRKRAKTGQIKTGNAGECPAPYHFLTRRPSAQLIVRSISRERRARALLWIYFRSTRRRLDHEEVDAESFAGLYNHHDRARVRSPPGPRRLRF